MRVACCSVSDNPQELPPAQLSANFRFQPRMGRAAQRPSQRLRSQPGLWYPRVVAKTITPAADVTALVPPGDPAWLAACGVSGWAPRGRPAGRFSRCAGPSAPGAGLQGAERRVGRTAGRGSADGSAAAGSRDVESHGGSAVRTMSERVFRDRRDAGRVLAGLLEHYRGRDDVVVLGLPRGGVPVAYEIATALDAPLDVFVVRKLGVPGHEELAMGAIASGGGGGAHGGGVSGL